MYRSAAITEINSGSIGIITKLAATRSLQFHKINQ